MQAAHADFQAKMERDLRRWNALGVKEARKQRKRQQEIDLNITRLSAAQLITEERMTELAEAQRALIVTVDEIVRGRNNGGPQAHEA